MKSTVFVLPLLLLNGVIDVSHAVAENSAVRALVYADVSEASYDKCIRLMNGTKQIGCQSSLDGNVGVLFHVNSSDGIVEVTKGKYDPYIVLIHADYFDGTSAQLFKSSGKVGGIIVYANENYTGKAQGWSPEPKCPRYIYGLYNESHGSEYAKHVWNEPGNALSEDDYDFPVFFMKNDTATDLMIKCHDQHNLDGSYPLCAAQMKARMDGAVSTETCIRRNNLQQNNLSPIGYCDEMGGYNIVGTLQTTSSSKVARKPVILITAAMDSRSFILESSVPGANSATGFITLLSVSEALGMLSREERNSMHYDIVFVLFDGEAFDNMGSTRMVYDMSKDSFPFKLKKDTAQPASFNLTQVEYVIEIGQLGHVNGEAFMHFDPISSSDPNGNISQITNALKEAAQSGPITMTDQSPDIGLIPSSLQAILKERNVSGIVVTDFDQSYKNKYYFGIYDTPRNLGVEYNINMKEEDAILNLNPLASKLSDVANVISKAVYKLATGKDKSFEANVTTIQNTLYCYFFNDSCTMFLNLVDSSQSKFTVTNSTVKRYVSAYKSGSLSRTAYMARNILFQNIAEFVNKSKEDDECKAEENDETLTYLSFKRNGTYYCYSAPVFQVDGRSPFNLFSDYDYANGQYPAWSESKWKQNPFKLTVFLVQDPVSQGLVFFAGLLVFLFSLIIVGVGSRKSDILFNSGDLL